MIETARDPRAIDTSAYRNDCMARGTDQLDLPRDFEQALFFQKDVLATYLLRPDQFAAVPQVPLVAVHWVVVSLAPNSLR